MFPGWTAAALVLALIAGHATHGVDASWQTRAATTCSAESLDPGIAHTSRLLERGTSPRGPARSVSGHHAITAARWAFAGDPAAFTLVATQFVSLARAPLSARAARSRGPPLA